MINNRLKEIRMREYMMNQKDFADFLDIGQSNYNLIESNKKQVTLEQALKIARKLNKVTEDIFKLVE